MIRNVLVADDHPICVEAMKLAVASVDGSFQVICVETIAEVQSVLRDGDCHALLLDLALKDSEGLANLTIALSIAPKLRVLIVSGNDSPTVIARAAALGAHGFLSKSAPVEQMRSATSVVLEGGTYFPQLRDREEDASMSMDRLSPAQLRVVIELAKGSSNKIIAHQLSISEATVKSHLSAIYRTLGVTNRAQAILALQQANGEMSPEKVLENSQ